MQRSLPTPPDPAASPGTDSLRAVVQRIVFANPDNGWTVLRLDAGPGRPTATAVGKLLGVQPGETLRLSGEWQEDPKYGRQFRVDSYVTLKPESLEGMKRYLGSGMVPGIGPVMAARLVDEFGLDTLDVIEKEPERLGQVEGIGPTRSRRIREAWREQREIRDVMVFLQSHGISTAQAIRIYKRYGADAVAAIREDPYRLASEVFGIGFQTADRIAASIGIPPDSPRRAAAGLLYTLDRAGEDGHVYLPRERLLQSAVELLEMPRERLEEALSELARVRRAVVEEIEGDGGPAVFLPVLHRAERASAGDARRLLATARSDDDEENGLDALLARFEKREGIELAGEQREAVNRGLTEPLLVITGGPGTGKTTLIQALVRMLASRGRSVLLAAPTGRAAKRLGEATGGEARTVHRLLEFEPRSRAFLRHRGRPLEADVVIVDEASMLDCPLSACLFQAVPDGARLVLVGDVDQLPSVGPGRVLDDLIRSGRLPLVRLGRIFRQAAASRIVRNAHRIRRGEMPELEADGGGSDFFFIERRDPPEILSTLEYLVTERIPKSFRLDPKEQIQVLTPMRRGLLGADRLNERLQERINPGGRRLPVAGERFRLGDRVMQLRNNYDLDVFNGDIGRVSGCDEEEGRLEVTVDGRRLLYERADLDELALAYACSVHKSQGSEYPCVVMPFHTQHHLLLERNLLYTAVTRARRLMVVVGSPRAVAIAVRNWRREERFSRLAERLAERRPTTASDEPS